MKKLFTFFIFAAILFLASPLQALAAGASVDVFVFDQDGNPVNDADVTITCNTTTKNANNPGGLNQYQATFGNSQCDDGDTVTANASNGSGAGTANSTVFDGEAVINLTLQSNVSVPEYGAITAAIAFAGAAGAFLIFRKRAHSRV